MPNHNLNFFSLKTVDIIYLNSDYQKITTDEDTDVQVSFRQIFLICQVKDELHVLICTQEYEYGLEYAGISNSGKRVMGLGHYNPLEPIKEPDSLFTWNVPKSWSLEDAATVPMIYAQVRTYASSNLFRSPFRNRICNFFFFSRRCITPSSSRQFDKKKNPSSLIPIWRSPRRVLPYLCITT